MCRAGFSLSAFQEAAKAIPLLLYLWRKYNSKDIAKEAVDCYLTAANASLVRRGPRLAQRLLEHARDLAALIGRVIGLEWNRQMGVVCLQNGDISEAEGFFRKVAETGEPATEGFPGSRHLGLIQPADGEECAAHLAVTAAGSGKNSLPYAVHMVSG